MPPGGSNDLNDRTQVNRERSKLLRDRSTALVEAAREIQLRAEAVRRDADAGIEHSASVANRRPWLIVIAASAGGVDALKSVVHGLPVGLRAAVVIVLHRKPERERYLQAILDRETALPVRPAAADERIQRGVIYLANPDMHLTVSSSGRFAYVDGTRVRGLLSSANPLLETASRWFGMRVIAVVLSGSGCDATDGVQAVKARGGCIIVQDPASAGVAGMPSSAIRTGVVDQVLPAEQIAPALVSIIQGGGAPCALSMS